MEKEIYSIDINASKTFLIYGGNDQYLKIIHNGIMFRSREIFSDSIIYVKFFDSLKLFLVTMDGGVFVIEMMESSSEGLKSSFADMIVSQLSQEEGFSTELQIFDNYLKKELVQLGKDVTFVSHSGRVLFVGCKNGEICVFIEAQDEHFVLEGHKSGINGIEIRKNFIFTSSENNFIVFRGNSVIFNLKTELLRGFCLVDSIHAYLLYDDNVCVLKRSSSTIPAETIETNFNILYGNYEKSFFTKIYDINLKGTECMLKINDTFIIGGECLMMINQGREYKMEIKNLNFLANKDNLIVFSTLDNKVGIGDYRETEFGLYDTMIGLVYDLLVNEDTVYLVGEGGINCFTVKP